MDLLCKGFKSVSGFGMSAGCSTWSRLLFTSVIANHSGHCFLKRSFRLLVLWTPFMATKQRYGIKVLHPNNWNMLNYKYRCCYRSLKETHLTVPSSGLIGYHLLTGLSPWFINILSFVLRCMVLCVCYFPFLIKLLLEPCPCCSFLEVQGLEVAYHWTTVSCCAYIFVGSLNLYKCIVALASRLWLCIDIWCLPTWFYAVLHQTQCGTKRNAVHFSLWRWVWIDQVMIHQFQFSIPGLGHGSRTLRFYK